MSSSSTIVITPPPRTSSLKRPARAGWISKLSTPGITNKPRWQLRFFVLVDTELRCYRNQHTDTPSAVIQLKDICLVVPVAVRRLNCFRLEPIVMGRPGSSTIRPLTLACESAKELADWVGAIQLRLDYPSRPRATATGVSMSVGASSTATTTLTRAYTAPTNKPAMSIIQRRRGGGSSQLSPIMIHPLDRGITTTATSDSSPSSSSSSSPLSSPSTITLSPTSPPIFLTPCCKPNPIYVTVQAAAAATAAATTTEEETADSDIRSSLGLLASATASLSSNVSPSTADAYSPTFLQYKKRFRL